jgi:hypothetical protein
MYSDTIVLSGPEVMLSSSASVAASHSPRPQSAPIGSPGSAGSAAVAGRHLARASAARSRAAHRGLRDGVGDQAAQSGGRSPQGRPPAGAGVDDRVGRYLVHGQDEVVEPCPGQPGVRALRGDLAP